MTAGEKRPGERTFHVHFIHVLPRHLDSQRQSLKHKVGLMHVVNVCTECREKIIDIYTYNII